YFPDKTFRPEQPLSRAETVSLLIKAKEKEPPPHDESFQIFTDVLTSHWAADYIAEAYKKKITYGYPDRTFKPRNTTSRAEGITFLTRFDGLALSLKDVLSAPYSDVPLHHWALREILAAKDNQYLNYIKGEKLGPKQILTRAELAEMLYRTDFTKTKLNDFIFEQPSVSGVSIEAAPSTELAPPSRE
ncbi:MAG: S-layer homology domain-containing protein, partial [Candidatus Margulisiibacteriota bacterium]